MTTLVFETGDTFNVDTGQTVHAAAERILDGEDPTGETRTILEIIDALGNAADRGDHEKTVYEILVDGVVVDPKNRLSSGEHTIAIRRQ